MAAAAAPPRIAMTIAIRIMPRNSAASGLARNATVRRTAQNHCSRMATSAQTASASPAAKVTRPIARSAMHATAKAIAPARGRSAAGTIAGCLPRRRAPRARRYPGRPPSPSRTAPTGCRWVVRARQPSGPPGRDATLPYDFGPGDLRGKVGCQGGPDEIDGDQHHQSAQGEPPRRQDRRRHDGRRFARPIIGTCPHAARHLHPLGPIFSRRSGPPERSPDRGTNNGDGSSAD